MKKRSLDEAEIDLDLEEASTPLGTPLGPTPATSPSAASKRSRNRWPKGGGINPNSKELKINPNRKVLIGLNRKQFFRIFYYLFVYRIAILSFSFF